MIMKGSNSKIISISNQKGGVGKTTSAINIASYLAATEISTLLIDMDPQANSTSGLVLRLDHMRTQFMTFLLRRLNQKMLFKKLN